MEYVPEYAKGEIVVFFKKQYEEIFVKEFGETLGYKMLGVDHIVPLAYIFRTEIDKEQGARQEFEAYTEFVEATELRDIKLEKRWNCLDDVVDKIKDVYEQVDSLSDDEYNQKLEDIRGMIK